MKISHSAVNKYSTCPKSYEFHYVKKIRPTWTSSALLFGDALDKAYNELLLPTGKDAFEVFIKGWTYGLINKVAVYIPTSSKVLYADKDFDITLLTQADRQDISERIKKGDLQDLSFEDIAGRKKSEGWESLTEEEKSFYNIYAWHSMKNKAKYMIDGYREKILPRIKKVHEVQHEIKADNGAGDDLTGFIDLIAEIDDHGVVILDNKTSARDYEWDSAMKSPQLALYLHMVGEQYNTRKVGFIVTKKNLAKNKVKTCSKCGNDGSKSRAKTCDAIINDDRCHGEWTETTSPEAEFQVIVQDMPKRFEELAIEAIDDVTKAVNLGVFPRNLSSCFDTYGGKCPFLSLCHKGKMDGLVEEK